MKRDNDRQTAIILSIVGIVPVIWLALLIAPSISGGLPEIAANAWIKSEFLMPKKLVFHSTNVYYELMKPSIEQKQKDHFRESKT